MYSCSPLDCGFISRASERRLLHHTKDAPLTLSPFPPHSQYNALEIDMMGPHTSTYSYAPPAQSGGPATYRRQRQPSAAHAGQTTAIPGVQGTHVRDYSLDLVRRFVVALNVSDDIGPAAHSLESLRAARREAPDATEHNAPPSTSPRGPLSVGNMPLRGHLPPAPGDISTGNLMEALKLAGVHGAAPGDEEGAVPDVIDLMDEGDFDIVKDMASTSHMRFRLLHSEMAKPDHIADADAANGVGGAVPSQLLHTEDLHDLSRLEGQTKTASRTPLSHIHDELETLYHCVLRRTARERSQGTPSQHSIKDVPHLYRVPGNHSAEAGNGRECFLHLTSLMAQLNMSDLETYAAPRLQGGSNASSVLVDALFELASPSAQGVLARDLLALAKPNVRLVSRALHAVVFLDTPAPVLVAAVEQLAFPTSGNTAEEFDDELASDALLALGILVRRLRESGRCEETGSDVPPVVASDSPRNITHCHRLLTRIEAELELGAKREPLHPDGRLSGLAASDYHHSRYRRMSDGVRLASPATEEDLKRHTRHSVVLEALGNTGHEAALPTLLSHATSGEHAPLTVRDAALHALRHYDHPKAEEELVRHVLTVEHRQLRRTARAAYAARNRELSLDVVETAALDLRERTLHNMTLPRHDFYTTGSGLDSTLLRERDRRGLLDKAAKKYAELLSLLAFDLVLPGVDWRKSLGAPQAIGASAGLIIQNEARFLQVSGKLAPLRLTGWADVRIFPATCSTPSRRSATH